MTGGVGAVAFAFVTGANGGLAIGGFIAGVAPVIGGGGLGTNAGGGGTGLLADGVGIGGRAMGGGGTERAGAFGIGGRAIFGGSGAAPLAGERTGKLIRALSRIPLSSPMVFGGVRGGKVIRTVSFFGSFRSLIPGGEASADKFAEVREFVTR